MIKLELLRGHEIESYLNVILNRRYTKKELLNKLKELLNVDTLQLQKTYRDFNRDDSFITCINDYIFIEIYFLKTNEKGILYITEIGVEVQ